MLKCTKCGRESMSWDARSRAYICLMHGCGEYIDAPDRENKHLYYASRVVSKWPPELQGLLGPPPKPIFGKEAKAKEEAKAELLAKLDEAERRLEEIEKELAEKADDEPSRWEMMAP